MTKQIKQLELNDIKSSMNCVSNSSRQVAVAIAACSVETAAVATSAAVKAASVTVTAALIMLDAIELALLTAAIWQFIDRSGSDCNRGDNSDITCNNIAGKCGGNNHYRPMVWVVMLVVALTAEAVSTQVV